MPPLTEYRSLSPNGDAQIVHMVPAATSPHVTTNHTERHGGGGASGTLSSAHYRHNVASRLDSTLDPVSQWRRYKIPAPPPKTRSRHPADNQEEEDEEDDFDDANSFSSMRVVRDQDKPSRRKLSEWRNSIIRRKRQQLALAMATGQWDALSPSSRAASLLDEVGNHYAAGKATGKPSGVSARILPFIPDILPKSERTSTATAGSTAMFTGAAAAGEPLGSSYPLKRKDAKKRKEAAFSYFGRHCGGFTGKNGSNDPGTVNSLAESLAHWDISSSLPSCGVSNCGTSHASKTSSQQQDTLAASLLSRWTCQESRQDEDVADTSTLRTVPEGEDEETDADERNKDGSPSGRESKKSKKPSQQRSQVALEVIKLRKELKRLKHIVQTKKNKKEVRDREMAALACGGAGISTPAESTLTVSAAASQDTSNSITRISATTAPHMATRVRFTEPLVTQVSYRPYTDPEDIEKLYFVEEELNELEWDRQTVADDQFEVIMASSDSAKEVRIAHQTRRLLALHPQDREGLPHSLSDLSVY